MSIPIFIPMPKTRKGAIITMTIVSAVWLILLIVFLVTYYNNLQMLKESGNPDFYTLEIEDLRNDLIVHGTIDTAIDIYAERYETNLGKQTTTDLYYIVPIYEIGNADNFTTKYFISFVTSQKHFDEMESIIEQTWTEVPQLTELNLENAILKDLPQDYSQYLSEWIEAPDFYDGGSFIDWCAETNVLNSNDKEIIKSKFVPYIISETSGDGTNPLTAWIFLGAFILSVCLLLYVIFKKGPIKGFPEIQKTEDFCKLRELEDETL